MPGDVRLDAGQSATGNDKDSGLAEGARLLSRSRRKWRLSLGFSGLLAAIWPATAYAQQANSLIEIGRISLGTMEVIQLALFFGITCAAMMSAILMIRERARTAAENVQLRERVANIDATLQRSDALLNLKDQRILVWSNDDRKAELVGTLPARDAPEDRATFLAFGRWLTPRCATQLERAISTLREDRQPFDIVVENINGGLIEVQGRLAASYVAVFFFSLSDTLRDHARMREEHVRLQEEHNNLLGLLDMLKLPVWTRDSTLR